MKFLKIIFVWFVIAFPWSIVVGKILFDKLRERE